ncbi:MAG: hypothetical protein JWM72_2020 [Actinomycetia bacterium]|nr:hypothetical protein [Actinomycetes bacterium]
MKGILFAVAIATTIGSLLLLENSHTSTDAGFVWGVSLATIAVPTWLAFLGQLGSDGVFRRIFRNLGELRTQVEIAREGIRSSAEEVTRLANSSAEYAQNANESAAALQRVDATTAESRAAIDALMAKAKQADDNARDAALALEATREAITAAREELARLSADAKETQKQILLAELTRGPDHENFHGQKSELSAFTLVPCSRLHGAILDRCRWSQFEAEQVDLKGARLRDAQFTNARANRAILDETDLTGASIAGTFRDASLDHAILQDTALRGSWPGARFSRCRDFTSTTLCRCDLTKATFDRIDYIQQSCFWLAVLDGSRFQSLTIASCDFRWAQLSGVVFSDVDIGLGVSIFEGALFKEADFSGVDPEQLAMLNLQGAVDLGGTRWGDFDALGAGVLIRGTSDELRIQEKHLELLRLRHGHALCPTHEQPTMRTAE